MTRPDQPHEIVDRAMSRRADHRLRWLVAVLVGLLILSLAGIAWSVLYALDQRAKAAQAGVSLAERIAAECAKPTPFRAPAIQSDPDLCGDARDVVEDAPGASVPGPPGPQGPQGIPGLPGRDGTDGTNGRIGSPGQDGTNGANGRNGDDGEPGSAGSNGTDGQDGAPGEPGPAGPSGPPGPAGKDGRDGTTGPQGPQGVPGPLCPDGYTARDLTVVTPQGGVQAIRACVASG